MISEAATRASARARSDKSTDVPVLRLLQLTDPHLMADPDGTLLGVNTRSSLGAVIRQVRDDEPAPDLVIASGDIAQDGSQAAYTAFRSALDAFSCSSVWFAGNHDNVQAMQQAIDGTDASRRRVLAGGWQLIFLNSAVPGEVHGELAEAELVFLREALAEFPEMPALVSFHHHPVDINCEWMESIGLINSEELMATLAPWPQVKGLLWGHVHQEWDSEQHGLRLLATPSTCVQFEPGSSGFSLDVSGPGYRWLDLYADGRIDTHVGRARDFELTIDRDSTGY